MSEDDWVPTTPELDATSAVVIAAADRTKALIQLARDNQLSRTDPALHEQPNYRDTELARFNYEDLKAASRGTWSINDTIDPETRDMLQKIAIGEPSITADVISVNGHDRKLMLDAIDGDKA